MGSRVMRVNLADLKTFRVRCKVCNSGTVEVDVTKLRSALDCGRCRFCNHPHSGGGMVDLLGELETLLGRIAAAGKMLDVEVDLPLENN